MEKKNLEKKVKTDKIAKIVTFGVIAGAIAYFIGRGAITGLINQDREYQKKMKKEISVEYIKKTINLDTSLVTEVICTGKDGETITNKYEIKNPSYYNQ